MNLNSARPAAIARNLIPRTGLALAACIGLAFASGAQADAITDWNATIDSALATPPPLKTRVMAMAHIAAHDALNSISPRFESYGVVPTANPSASPGAAVAAAMYRVVANQAPAQAPALLVVYNARIAALPPCPIASPTCIVDGIAAGNAAADAILAQRTLDGSATPNLPYNLAPGPGVYQPTPTPTPPFLTMPSFAGWAYVTPFAMNSGSQFRMGPADVLDLSSSTYTRDFNEVKLMGSANAESLGNRSAAQSANARFWPPASWNEIARILVNGSGQDLWQNARLFALVNIAQADGAIAVFDTKYTYNFWRPVTAIRAASTDGNPDTAEDAAWSPYLVTPPYPDYVCGLPTLTGAASEVLERYFNTEDLPFTLTAGGVTQTFANLDQARNAAVDARVHAGIHFRTGCRLGIVLGTHVGAFAFQHYLRPLKPQKGNVTFKATGLGTQNTGKLRPRVAGSAALRFGH